MKDKEISIGVQKCCKISFEDGTVRFYTFIVFKGGGMSSLKMLNIHFYISILLFVFTGVNVIV